MMRALGILLFSTAISVSAQDLTIVSKVTHDGGPPRTAISYISSDHVRMSQGDDSETIVDMKSGQMTTLDGKKKTYYITTRQDMDAFAAKMRDQMNSPEMQHARQSMNKASSEDQKKMNAAMSSMFALDVRDAGTTRKVAGYPCENWKVTMGQFSTSEECMTNDLKFPANAWTMYRGFADSMKSVMSAMGPMANSAASMQEQFKKMKGFPLANKTTIDIMGHKSVSSSEVTEVRRGPIPASAWDIPAGYTKIDNPMLKAMARRRR